MHQQFNTAVQHTAVRERIITDKPTYLHGDHLGSASLATDGSGGKVSAMRYYPYGATRSGALRTDRRYTGQRWEASLGLYDYGARYYDPALGRFIQADTVVPGAGNPQALNRYAYVLNSPLKYTDPSGYDPLGPDWEDAFRAAHGGADPTDADRQARLYSVIFPGPVSGERDWTEDDWNHFSLNRVDLFMEVSTGRESLADFADEIRHLSQVYSPGEEEQFVWAIALLYAGVPYGTTRGGVIRQGFGGPRVSVPECAGEGIQCSWLTHGMEGFSHDVANTGEENTHHYAGHLLAGYYLREWVADLGTRLREWGQGQAGKRGTDQLDVNMGHFATLHGRGLAEGRIAPWELPDYILTDLSPDQSD